MLPDGATQEGHKVPVPTAHEGLNAIKHVRLQGHLYTPAKVQGATERGLCLLNLLGSIS
eukprot:m.72992 g.72992  ORF g.72992 m.72992 type:complete len:59 (-) comp12376_c0_seq1:1338-1514(-)